MESFERRNVDQQVNVLDRLASLIDTPDNIYELGDTDISNLCDSFGKTPNAKFRVMFIKEFYESLGYQISNDLLYALADEPKEMFIIAPAGGGKTTTVNSKVGLSKIFRKTSFTGSGRFSGDRVLSLVFNKANVPDMANKHAELISKVNTWKLNGIPSLDYWLECRTFHGFCLKWIMEYRSFLGLNAYPKEASDIIINPELQSSLLDNGIASVCKKLELTETPNGLKANNLLGVRNLCVETKRTLEDIKDTDKVIDLGIDVESIQTILTGYERAKGFMKRLDNTDLLSLFYKLLTTNEEALNRIKSYYDLITADEFQDFTPLLREILYMIVGENTQLICIGDDDQAIYGFRGANNDNVISFKEHFPNAKIHLLQTNRRCPSNVLDLALNVINMNKNRFPKKMHALKGKGEIYFKPYNDRLGQFMSIVKELKTFSSEELSDSVISYREKSPSVVISNLLYEADIPFYINSGNGPFDYPLLKHVLGVMYALQYPDNKENLLNLYKVLPITRKELAEVLNYDLIKKKFLDDNKISLDKIPFSPSKMSNSNFVQIYRFLVSISKNIDNVPIKSYSETIISLVKKYYYNYVVSKSKLSTFIYDFCSERCVKFFNVNFNFKELYAYYQKQRDILFERQKNKRGVCLSTFHALKGLEFDSVFVTDLCESIYPNFSMIDFRPYDEETKQELKESETRLFYVVITRSKRRLYLYYDKHDPSVYVVMLLGGYDGLQREEKKEENIVNVSITNSNPLSNLLNQPKVTPVREEIVVDVNKGADVSLDEQSITNGEVEINLDDEVSFNESPLPSENISPNVEKVVLPNDQPKVTSKPFNFRDNLVNSLLNGKSK